jgi:hypothetical protein
MNSTTQNHHAIDRFAADHHGQSTRVHADQSELDFIDALEAAADTSHGR